MRLSNALALSLLLASPLAAKTAAPAAANVTAAVADTANRTPDNVKLDEGRKPAELLQFFGLRQGMRSSVITTVPPSVREPISALRPATTALRRMLPLPASTLIAR